MVVHGVITVHVLVDLILWSFARYRDIKSPWPCLRWYLTLMWQAGYPGIQFPFRNHGVEKSTEADYPNLVLLLTSFQGLCFWKRKWGVCQPLLWEPYWYSLMFHLIKGNVHKECIPDLLPLRNRGHAEATLLFWFAVQLQLQLQLQDALGCPNGMVMQLEKSFCISLLLLLRNFNHRKFEHSGPIEAQYQKGIWCQRRRRRCCRRQSIGFGGGCRLAVAECRGGWVVAAGDAIPTEVGGKAFSENQRTCCSCFLSVAQLYSVRFSIVLVGRFKQLLWCCISGWNKCPSNHVATRSVKDGWTDAMDMVDYG